MTENISIQTENNDKLKEECGVFGVYDFDGGDVASTIYYGLLALQHRGQESCGIAVSDTKGPKGRVLSSKDMGAAGEAEGRYRCRACTVFHRRKLLPGKCTAPCTQLCKGNSGTGT